MPSLGIPVPIEEAVSAPVVVGVPVKGVCSCELLKVRSTGADIDALNAGAGPWVVVASLLCFLGDASAKGSEPNELSRMILFQIIFVNARIFF